MLFSGIMSHDDGATGFEAAKSRRPSPERLLLVLLAADGVQNLSVIVVVHAAQDKRASCRYNALRPALS